MTLNEDQLDNLITLLKGWESIRRELDRVTDLAFVLLMTSLGEELKWSQEKIGKLLLTGLMDSEK